MSTNKVSKSVDLLSSEIEKMSFDSDVYCEVARSARLRDVKLVGSKYIVNLEAFEGTQEAVEMKYSFNGISESIVIGDSNGTVMGHYKWSADVKFGRKTGVKLSTDYHLAYTEIGGLDRNHVAFYFNKIGRFTTYPYFRSLFSVLTSESGLMMPPLPTLTERVD